MQQVINHIVNIVGQQWLIENNVVLTPDTRLSDLCFDYVDCGVLQYYLHCNYVVEATMSLQDLVAGIDDVGATSVVEE